MQDYELISDWREIYRKDNKAYKMYSTNKSVEYVIEMARIQSLAYDAGLPVPAVYGVKNIGGRFALEMDYLKREPFIEESASESERIKSLKIMAELQCRLNSVNAETFGLPKFTTYIMDEVKQTPYLTDQIKNSVYELLFRLDTRKTNFCHGDFHGGNVIFDGESHWIIDWDGACMGDPIADACMMYFYEKRLKPHTADIYMQEYCRLSNIKQDDFLAWLPVIAAYQVNIKTEDQRNYILSVINAWYEK